MNGPLSSEASLPAQGTHHTRLILAIVSTLVLLSAIGIVEVVILALVTIVSSGTNHR